MESRRFLRLYAKSPFGIVSLLLALGAGIAALSLGAGAAAGSALAVCVLAASVLLAIITGLAPRAVAAEGEREDAAHAAERLARVSAAVDRLSALRLPDGPVARARELVVLEARRAVEICAKAETYDPRGAAAVDEALALVGAWLRERDSASTERRYGLADADPFAEPDARVSAALEAKAAAIVRGGAEAAGLPPPSATIEIEEELR